jgi:hypothetical protein
MRCISVILILEVVQTQLYPRPGLVQNFAGKRADQGIVSPGSTRAFIPLHAVNRTSLSSRFGAVGVNVITIPVNSPTTASVSILLGGSLFGAQDFSARIRVGITSSQASNWISLSSISCKISAGTSKTDAIVVTIISRLVSDPVTGSISYDSGLVSLILRKNVPSTGSFSISVYGTNMGLGAFSFSERLERSGAEATSWASDSAIFCSGAHGMRASRIFVVSSGSVSASVTSFFSFSRPVLRTYSTELDLRYCSDGNDTAVFAASKVYGCKGENISSLLCKNGFKMCSGLSEVARLGVNFSPGNRDKASTAFYEARTCFSITDAVPAVSNFKS